MIDQSLGQAGRTFGWTKTSSALDPSVKLTGPGLDPQLTRIDQSLGQADRNSGRGLGRVRFGVDLSFRRQ